jgi:hypothetical protein
MQPVDPIAAYYARISALGETGRADFTNQGQISPDTGGSKSYGVFGLNTWGRDPTKTSAGRFAQKYGSGLGLTAPIGSPEFDSQWKNAATNNADALKNAQLDWYGSEIGGNVAPALTGIGIPEGVAKDPRVQGYFSDRMVQQGAGSVAKHASRINDAWSASNNDPVAFLHNVSAADKQALPGDFQTYLSQHPDHVKGLTNRVDRREQMALGGDEATPSLAFAPNPEGAPMADAPALSSRNINGNGVLTDPSVAERLWNAYTQDPALGDSLQQAGSYLTSIADPKGGAALLAASKTPTNRFSVGTDKLGRQFIFDTHKGVTYDQYGNASGPGVNPARAAGGATTANGLPSSNVPGSSEALAATPEGQLARAKQEQEDSAKTLASLRDSASEAKAMQDRAEEALRLVNDPNVSQGAFGNIKAFAKNAAGSLSGGTLTPAGTDQTEALKKNFAQLQGQYLSSQKGVRFAGPEIKFSELANPDLDKPAAVNAQILQDYISPSKSCAESTRVG